MKIDSTLAIVAVYIFVALFALFFVLQMVFAGQCPVCKKRQAMKRTGRTREEVRYGIFVRDFYEVGCQYCDHREWKEDTPSNG